MSLRTSPHSAPTTSVVCCAPRLLRAREEFAAGRMSAEQLRAAEDDAIRSAVEMQRAVGLLSATGGEFRRASWHMDFTYGLGGIERAPGDIKVQFQNEQGKIEFTPAAIRVGQKVHLRDPIFAADFEFLSSAGEDGVTPKLTIPSPSMVHYRGGRAAIDPDVYADLDEFWVDLTAAYADQVRAMADFGCHYLQFDDTSLAYLNDPRQREAMTSLGEDAEHLHETYILGLVTTKRGELESKDLLKRRIEDASQYIAVEGSCHNREQALEIMRQARLRRPIGELVDVVGARDRVVVIMRPAPEVGKTLEEFANLTTFRDGKVVEMVHYPDPGEALAAAGV